MGLSASQARYLMLVAKQSDLQYQGQQINQERAVLSQQVSELYNSLLAMEVPTPPSTTEFQKVKYAGAVGTSQYFFYASSVKPQAKEEGQPNKYTIDFGLTAYGDSLSAGNYQTVKAETDTDTDKQQALNNAYTAYMNALNADKAAIAAYNEACQKYKSSQTEANKTAMDNAYAKKEQTGKTLSEAFSKYLDARLNCSKFTIGGIAVEEVDSAYYDAIKNAQIKDAQGNVYGPEDFYMYTTTTTSGDTEATTVHFALKKDIHSAAEKENNTTQVLSYTYSPTGKYTKNVTKENCELEFDVATGRITTVKLPIGKDTDGNYIMQTIDVAASTETDETAYKDAYAQYEYKKYLYDKEQQDINAKTEVIQQEDRNLELKLQRLDTENTEIKTELDAVKEVLKNNVETSYKSFSG